MAHPPKPLRRVVTGHDAAGRSCVLYDSAAPNVVRRSVGSVFYELWTIDRMPAALSGREDGGAPGRPLTVSPPLGGAHFRVIQSQGDRDAPANKADQSETFKSSLKTETNAERMQDARHWGMHRTRSVDYAFMLEGERHMILEESDVLTGRGDVVIQLGNWHSWENRSRVPVRMAFIMIGGEYA